MKLRKIITKNNKGQIDHATMTFAGVLIFLFLVGPIVLKMVISIIDPTVTALNQSGSGGEEASNAVVEVKDTFLSFYEGAILFIFLLVTLLLFVSAFLIDVNPFFAIFYVVLLVFLLIFAPEVMRVVDNIYESNTFAEEVTLLQSVDFLRQNFGIVLLSIGILSLLIIYGKIRYFGSS